MTEAAKRPNVGALDDRAPAWESGPSQDSTGDPGAYPQPGDNLGRFTLVRCIAYHEFSRLYLAEDRFMGRRAAVKVIRAEPADSEQFAHRFLERARAVFHLKHPNLVRIFEYGVEEDLCYIASEFINGADLSEALRVYASRGERMPLGDVLSIMKQAAAGMAHLHTQGTHHGNLKPSNILLSADGSVLISDLHRKYPEEPISSRSATEPIIRTDSADVPMRTAAANDVRSLAITLYLMLTGKAPRGGRSSTPDDLSTLPAGFQKLLQPYLSPKPNSDVPSASELARALGEAAQEGGPNDLPPEGKPVSQFLLAAARTHPRARHDSDDRMQWQDSAHTPNAPWPLKLLGLATALGVLCAGLSIAAYQWRARGQDGQPFAAPATQAASPRASAANEVQVGRATGPVSTPPGEAIETTTAQPAPTRVGPSPNVQIVLEEEAVTVINISGETLSLANVTFRRMGEDGAITALFQASTWNRVAAYPVDRLPPGDCYQLRRLGTKLSWPVPCEALQGWIATANPDWYFWLPQGENETFHVAHDGSTVHACPIGKARCAFFLPP